MPMYERDCSPFQSVCTLSFSFTHMRAHMHTHTQVPMQILFSLRAGPCPEGWPLSPNLLGCGAGPLTYLCPFSPSSQLSGLPNMSPSSSSLDRAQKRLNRGLPGQLTGCSDLPPATHTLSCFHSHCDAQSMVGQGHF